MVLKLGAALVHDVDMLFHEGLQAMNSAFRSSLESDQF